MSDRLTYALATVVIVAGLLVVFMMLITRGEPVRNNLLLALGASGHRSVLTLLAHINILFPQPI
jgi:hypothetical protein